MKIANYEPFMGDLERMALQKCIDDNWITAGPMVKAFETMIAQRSEVKYAQAVCNGTMALFVLLKAAGIGKGDKVIVPDFTHVATANAVILCGATPVFCDVDDTLCIDVENMFSMMKKDIEGVKAIMPVGVFGQSPDMDAVMSFADIYNLMILQDSAQDLDITWRGLPLLSYGRGSILSFYGDKLVTTGEGGMVLTKNTELFNKVRKLVHHGSEKMGTYYHESTGWNFRLTDLHAAVGLAQLERIEYMKMRKMEIEVIYRTEIGGVVKFLDPHRYSNHIPFRTVAFCDRVEALQAFLGEKGIETRRVFYPLHLQPCYSHLNQRGRFTKSTWAYEHGLSLPSSVGLKDDEIDYICESIRRFYE